MVSFAGFQCRVELFRNGVWTPAIEYQTSYPFPNVLECFIESEEGVQYRVVWKEEQKSHLFVQSSDLSCKVAVDGQTHSQRGLPAKRPPHNEVTVAGARKSLDQVFPFVFSKLQLTDEDARACKDERVVKEMGTIVFEVCRVKLGNSVPRVLEVTKPDSATLHEKAKKGILDHSTCFGNEQPSALTKRKFDSTVYIDDPKSPFLQIIFKYRSPGLLTAIGIKPAPLPPRRGLDGSDADVQVIPQKRRKVEKAGIVQPQVKKEEHSQAASSSSKQVIEIIDDSEDEETELQRLRRLTAKLEAELKKVKQEGA